MRLDSIGMRARMKVAITGSTGLIGSALVPRLRAEGHQVVRIVRRAAEDDEVQWNPALGTIDRRKLEGIDAVVHLAGAGIGNRRWSTDYKQLILSSRDRWDGDSCEGIGSLGDSALGLVERVGGGLLGLHGDEVLTEYSDGGTGFLADVCARWEASASAAARSGIRVVNLRTGVVLSTAGGALKKQLWPFRLGLGARLGAGDRNSAGSHDATPSTRSHFSWEMASSPVLST